MTGKLHHNSDTAQAAGASCAKLAGNLHDETDGFRMPRGYQVNRLPRSVQSLGTTAPDAEPFRKREPIGSPEWVADLEYVWRTRVAAPIASLAARAKKRRRQAKELGSYEIGNTHDGNVSGAFEPYRVALIRSAEWCDDRARALAMARSDIVEACGQRWRSVRCGCKSLELRVGCEQPQLCGTCRRRHWRAWSQRITLGLDEAIRRERAHYYRTPHYRRRGMTPGLYLITLTAPHSGDLATDRERMGAAVRKLFKHATKWGWWRTYALTWEATSGEDGKGHMHAHLAVISSWVPYTSEQAQGADVDVWSPRRRGERREQPRGLHEVWRDAMPGALVVDIKPPGKRGKGSDAARVGAEYLAKYVTKGIEPICFTGRKAGELLIAFRSRRKVTTSAGFWQHRSPECEHCKELWRSVGAPVSLQSLLPGAVLRSKAEALGYWIPRGGRQVALRWEADGG